MKFSKSMVAMLGVTMMMSTAALAENVATTDDAYKANSTSGKFVTDGAKVHKHINTMTNDNKTNGEAETKEGVTRADNLNIAQQSAGDSFDHMAPRDRNGNKDAAVKDK